jgi:ADP-heptose:LPS heptosyltransferase
MAGVHYLALSDPRHGLCMPAPAPASSLGNPRPPFSSVVGLPAMLTEREGLVVARDGIGSLPVSLAACRKILIVRLDFIGDWVLTTPFLANLRRSAPQAEITAVVLTRVFDLARTCGFVDRVVAVEASHVGPVEFLAADRGQLSAFVTDYGGGEFDLALVPRWDIDFNAALRIADGSDAGQVVGFSEACTPERQRANRGDDRYYSAVFLDRSEAHEVEHKLAFLEALGGTVAHRELALHLDRADTAAADRFIVDHLAGARRFLAVAPFATGRKQLPVERTIELTARLAEEFAVPVVVIGSPVHGEAAERFMAGLEAPAVSSVGVPLGVSAALIGRAEAFLGMDSGPAHMAAALRTPAAVIFSHPLSGSPTHVGAPQRFRPWAHPDEALIVQPDAPLAPCVEGCEADEPHCIAQLDVEAIYPAIAAFMAGFMVEPAILRAADRRRPTV